MHTIYIVIVEFYSFKVPLILFLLYIILGPGPWHVIVRDQFFNNLFQNRWIKIPTARIKKKIHLSALFSRGASVCPRFFYAEREITILPLNFFRGKKARSGWRYSQYSSTRITLRDPKNQNESETECVRLKVRLWVRFKDSSYCGCDREKKANGRG